MQKTGYVHEGYLETSEFVVSDNVTGENKIGNRSQEMGKHDSCFHGDGDVSASDEGIHHLQIYFDILSCDNYVQAYVVDDYIDIVPDWMLPRFPKYNHTQHWIGGIKTQLHAEQWLNELTFEHDDYLKSYLKQGIQDGFHIIDASAMIDSYECVNYPSVFKDKAWNCINSLILDELQKGKYCIAESKPWCVHALGAIPKKDGSFRPITDCRRNLKIHK